jgi:2-isopropylmalate synthase
MQDLARESAQSGKLVIWEEAARDGAQAKTLMSGPQRVALARRQGGMFGAHGPHHLIFAAGFPSICREEFEAIRQLVSEVDNCTLASHGRATEADVNLGLRAMQGARYGRVTLFIPVSERMSWTLMHQPPQATLQQARNIVRYALDRAGGMPVDVAFADASRGEVGFVAETAEALTEEGVSIIKLCDTVGEWYPHQSFRFFTALMARISSKVTLGAHLHNDLGLAFANNLEALKAGVRVVASSWLGLGERNGLVPTEQFIFAVGHEPEQLAERLGYESNLWLTPPDLKQVVPLARQVSQITGTPLKVTDPIVGSGVNTISTGTPFIAPQLFQPFDPQAVLGVSRQVVLTQLASQRVITEVAGRLGFELNPEQTQAAMVWVKTQAYERNKAVISQAEFATFLTGLKALCPTKEAQEVIARP